MMAPAAIVTAMIERISVPHGAKRQRLIAIFAGCCAETRDLILCASLQVCAIQGVANAMQVVDKRLMDIAVAPADTWDRSRAEATGTFCIRQVLCQRAAFAFSRRRTAVPVPHIEKRGNGTGAGCRPLALPIDDGNREEATGT